MASRDRIAALDGLRAVAIGAVMISHGFLLADHSSRTNRAITYTAEQLGALGVNLFFAISGYLITTLLLAEKEESGHISLRAFYTRRAFRILPAAYLYLSALWIFRTPLESGELASAALFFSNYWPERSWFTQHFWSLSMEEHFYLFWPALLTAVGPRRAMFSAAGLIGAISFWRPWSLAHISWNVPELQRTDMRLDAFLYSAILAIAMNSPARQTIQPLIRSSSVRMASILAIAASAVWAVAGSARATPLLIQSASLPILMIWIVDARGSALHRLLETAPLRWIGRISYGLYLWQQWFLVGHSSPTLAEAVHRFLPAILETVCAATVSYYAVERFLLKFGRRISIQQQAAFTIAAQVSLENERKAPNPEGSAGIREKARGQTTGPSLY